MVDDEAIRSVGGGGRRVISKRQHRHHRVHDRRIVREPIEARMVRAVVERIERDEELDGLGGGRHGLHGDGDVGDIGYVVVGVDEAEVGEVRGGGVGDGGRDIYRLGKERKRRKYSMVSGVVREVISTRSKAWDVGKCGEY